VEGPVEVSEPAEPQRLPPMETATVVAMILHCGCGVSVANERTPVQVVEAVQRGKPSNPVSPLEALQYEKSGTVSM